MVDYDTIIIGGGPAGLTAGIYAARYRMKTLIMSENTGGLINEAHKVENYPGFESISGMDLMIKIADQTKKLGAEIKDEKVDRIEKIENGFKVISRDKTYTGKTIILALGTRRRKLNIKGEADYLGKGVSYCATCDAAFFREKKVGVVGGGDSAVSAAIVVAQFAKEVTIIYRKDKLRAEGAWIDEMKSNPKISVIYNANVVGLSGEKFLEKIKLDNGDDLELDGLFIEIGTVPTAALIAPLGVNATDRGFITVDKNRSTNIAGIYAAGDITDASNLKQMITAMAHGAEAAFSSFKYVKSTK